MKYTVMVEHEKGGFVEAAGTFRDRDEADDHAEFLAKDIFLNDAWVEEDEE